MNQNGTSCSELTFVIPLVLSITGECREKFVEVEFQLVQANSGAPQPTPSIGSRGRRLPWEISFMIFLMIYLKNSMRNFD